MSVLSVEGVSYRYPDGTEALRGVSFDIEDGACVGLVGPNGAGKTTLVSVLAGFFEPSAGSVAVGGVRMGASTLAEVRARVGFVFADPDDQLFMPTVLEDVCFGPLAGGASPEEAKGRALELLNALGIGALASKFPGHLSAGQKRLATLAGVLVQSPRLLVLDEPTAFLDPFARRDTLSRLKGLSQARLLVTHDLEAVVELCSLVLLLDEGRVVARGTPASVLGDVALMSAHRLERPHILSHGHPHS